ncbi:hypothetical protein C8R46DRAFT_29319 [Mycena filopes]|nr:hypothetical protein C8R46DRAFT_29319 [Mycena filopes]
MKPTSLGFEYPITRPFSAKYCLFLLAFGLVSTGVFITINVFLVGYDVVSITTTNFNTSRGLKLPWEAKRSPCEKHQLQLGDSFRTNISAFSYSIFDVQPDADATDTSVVVQGGFSYGDDDLSSCDVTQYEITVRPGDRLVTVTASIQCSPPIGFQAVTSWSYSNHGTVGTIPASMFPENSLARAITDAMNEFGGEAYYDIYAGSYITNNTDSPQKVYKVVANGHPQCDSPAACFIPTFDFYNAIGNNDLNILGGPSDIAADQANLYNLINIFYSAVRLDLGHWTPDNVFTNTTSFNHTIQPTDFVFAPNTAFRDMASSKGMAYANLTTPPSPNERTSPAVIQIPYTCNIKQRKSPASFAVSVISATLSMFLGAWGAALAILSKLARRNVNGGDGSKDSTSRSPATDLEYTTANSTMPYEYRSLDKTS